MKRKIPQTDLVVSKVCLGTAGYGDWVDEKTAFNLLDYFVSKGGNFIDTANCYGKWLEDNPSNYSEQIIGRWLKSRGNRKDIVISTKGGHPKFSDMYTSRISKAEIYADWEESAKALGTDYFDIYWLHRDSREKPIGEIIGILEGMRREGRIGCYGFSNYQPDRIKAALEYSDEQGYKGLLGIQNRWSLVRVNEAAMDDQTLVCMDSEMIGILAENSDRLSAISYTAAGSGFFSVWSKAESEQALPGDLSELYLNDINRKRMAAISEIAASRGISVGSIVLAWQMNKSFTAVPISAPSKIGHMDEMMDACGLCLGAEEMAALDAGEEF